WRRHRRVENVFEQPLSPNRRRRAMGVRRDGENARLAQQSPAALVGQRHPAEMASVYVPDAVVLRQLFVEEGVVRREQLDHAAVFLELAVEKQLDLAHERGSKVVVEPRELAV